jgi:hypothetical protein
MVPLSMLDLFTPVVPEKRLHPHFKRLISSTDWDIREVLSDWLVDFVDRDGKFVQEFQLTFNSCWWELYLFAALKSLGLSVDFSHAAPDFVIANATLTIEAVVSNPSEGSPPEWLKSLRDVSDPRDVEPRWLETLARLYNSLDGKRAIYERRYSAMPHVEGKPFILALHNFSTPDSFQLGDVAMQRLLYDLEKRETFLKNGKVALHLGIFDRPEYRDVSAVMYSSVATYGKVRALGRSNADLYFQAIRIRNNVEILPIFGKKADYQESLRDGLRIFHNPNASRPLPFGLFEVPDVRDVQADRRRDVHYVPSGW